MMLLGQFPQEWCILNSHLQLKILGLITECDQKQVKQANTIKKIKDFQTYVSQ